jgi:hypothetical protein
MGRNKESGRSGNIKVEHAVGLLSSKYEMSIMFDFKTQYITIHSVVSSSGRVKEKKISIANLNILNWKKIGLRRRKLIWGNFLPINEFREY